MRLSAASVRHHMARGHYVAVIDARVIAQLDSIDRSLEEMLRRVSRGLDRIEARLLGE
jgi:hypothetical protein